ncbi:MAG: hypothetical protein KAT86_04760 [Candidatus Latescibacteria bacterium]|nr:hypothetical protein [Candidatus Latescibacterota bacterium]
MGVLIKDSEQIKGISFFNISAVPERHLHRRAVSRVLNDKGDGVDG